MDLNNEKDVKEVIKIGAKLAFETLGVKDDNNAENTIRNAIRTFVTYLRDIEDFNFLPFEILAPEAVATFIVNNLIKRGILSKNLVDECEDGSKLTGYHKIIEDFKKKKYYHLFIHNETQNFIIVDKPNTLFYLSFFLDDPINCYHSPLDIALDGFKSNVFNNITTSDNSIIPVKPLLKDLKQNFTGLYNFIISFLGVPIVSTFKAYSRIITRTINFPTHLLVKQGLVSDTIKLDKYNISRPAAKPCYFRNYRAVSCMVEAVNQIVYDTMFYFILERNWSIQFVVHRKKIKIRRFLKPSHKYKIKPSNKIIVYLLNKLLTYVYSIFGKDDLNKIILNRDTWIKSNKQADQNELIRQLSIKFACLLNHKAKMSFNETVVNKLGEISLNDKLKYDEKFEKFAKDFENQWKFFTESDNPAKQHKNLFEVEELASKFYDRLDEDFPYVIKIFYYELFGVNPRMRIAKKSYNANTLFRKENLTLDEKNYMDCVYKHAHFRQLRHNDLYQKFYEVYFKICKYSEIAFHYLNPLNGVAALKEWVLNYLKFFDADIFSSTRLLEKRG